MPIPTHIALVAWLARLTGHCDAGQRAENSDHQRGSSATHCAAGSSVLSHCELGSSSPRKEWQSRRVLGQSCLANQENRAAPVPRFLTVFLAFSGIRPWFCALVPWFRREKSFMARSPTCAVVRLSKLSAVWPLQHLPCHRLLHSIASHRYSGGAIRAPTDWHWTWLFQ